MKIDLTGRAILITGGSRGIGAAAVEAFAAAGARVAIHCGRGLERARALADEVGGGAEAFQALALLCRRAVLHFRERGGGRILNISSRAAFRGDTPDYLAYAASKGAVVALTRSIARGFGKDGITAFDIAPGFTRTEMAQAFIDAYGEDFAMKDVALNRMTEPGDIAPTLVFLASGLADHATGTTIDLNAGSYVH